MIKNLSQTDIALKTGDAYGWSKKVGNEIQGHFDEMGAGEVQETGGKTFGALLQESIGKVNELQQKADVSMQKLASGESKDLQGTLLAVEHAEIAFKAMNQVRSKVIDAYKEIMRMQI
jgi:flagellar hook-basal body complex protein FliE